MEGDMNLIVLIPQKKGQITLDTMHENVKNGLKALQEHKRYEPNEQVGFWIPQFKVGQMSQGPTLANSDAQITNFKVSENTYVHDYIQQSAIELYVPPVSEGNLTFEVDEAKDIVINEEEFFVAVTLS